MKFLKNLSKHFYSYKPLLGGRFLGVKKAIAATALIVIIICISVCFALIHHSNSAKEVGEALVDANSQNLVKTGDWSHFAGAQVIKDGVNITPLNRAIVNQDGSGGQPNPPVNVRGPHLEVGSNFKLTYRLRGVPQKGYASFTLYGAVPIIYDEWRMQTPQIEIGINRTQVLVKIWNGTADAPIYQKTESISLSNSNTTVSLVYHGNGLVISVGGHTIGPINSYHIFNSGKVWFGADSQENNSGWILTYLASQSLDETPVKIVLASDLKESDNTSDSLRSLAQNKNLPIGVAVANYALFSDSGYRAIVAGQFSMLTPENELKPQFVHPQPSIYSFTEADLLVDFALANNMKVHGHTLEFSEANPRWMQDAPLAQRQQILSDHITRVVGHFAGRIDEWDVVNEPMSDNDETLRPNIWTAAMGEKYIDIAFKLAHQANPSAKLYINEYGLEQDGPRWDNFLNLVKKLKERGVPVDGVGFQAHIHEQGDEVDTQTLKNHMNILAQIGLLSRISEIDVYGDNLSLQAHQYSQALSACLQTPNCTSYTTWGATDHYGSTTELHQYPLQYGNDLLWDNNLQPKAAFYSLINNLK